MRLTYVLGWSRLSRSACQEQTIGTAAALARAGAEITLLAPQGPGDAPLTAEAVRAFHGVEGDFQLTQRPFLWPDTGVGPSYFWLRRALVDPAVGAADLALTRIPAVLGAGIRPLRPVVFDHYRPWPDQLPLLRGRFRGALAGDSFAGVVVHSHYAADSYLRLPIPPEKVLVAHNGFEPASMAPVLSKAQARAALGLAGDRPIVVYAGRLNRRKGLGQVMLVAGLVPEARFLLVGAEGDVAVERAAAAVSNVELVPWQGPDRLAAWLYAADVLLIPPSLDPVRRFGTTILPLKTFKYLAAGRPILAPQAPDTAELLRDGDNCLLVPADDPAAASAALRRLLTDPELAARLGANAQALGRMRTWDHRARRMLDFFARRLAAPGGEPEKAAA